MRTDQTGWRPRWHHVASAAPELVLVAILLVSAVLLLLRSVRRKAAVGYDVRLGPIHFELRNVVPTAELMIVALLVFVAIVLLVLAMDLLAFKRTTRPEALSDLTQSQRPLRRDIMGLRPAGERVRVTVLVPAHNEEHTLPAALRSLREQSRPPDEIIVVSDNSTDGTVGIATASGVGVFETNGNQKKKAGALNQILAELLPTMSWPDAVMVMDADTVLGPQFLEAAAGRLEARPDTSAVGGVFFGDEGPGLLRQLQRSEFARYSRDIARHQGRVFVLTGTATLFRAAVLVTVARHRGDVLTGTVGHVYDTVSLTEDNELTLALKTLGAAVVSPVQCQVRTELMPTWKDLWRQRERWQRGALENIGTYGLTSATARYWMQQLGLGYSFVALSSFFAVILIPLVVLGRIVFFPFWLCVGLIFCVERVVTVWTQGWKARLLAFPLVIELGYDFFLLLVYLKSIIDIAFGRQKGWHHLTEHTRRPGTSQDALLGADRARPGPGR